MTTATKRIYALVTKQGTAATETALCDEHYPAHTDEAAREARADVAPDSWRDCTGNLVLECIICGKKGSR